MVVVPIEEICHNRRSTPNLRNQYALLILVLTSLLCHIPVSSLILWPTFGAIQPLFLASTRYSQISNDECTSPLQYKSSDEADELSPNKKNIFRNNDDPTYDPPLHRYRRGRYRNVTQHVTNPYNIPRDPEERWEFFYKILVEFFIENGHTNVPSGPQLDQSLLRNWMAEQRRSYMKTLNIIPSSENGDDRIVPLSDEKKQRLDRAGFHWGQFGDIDVQKCAENNLRLALDPEFCSNKRDLEWVFMARKLNNYKIKYNNCDVPLDYKKDPKLARWVAKQRRLREIMPKRRRATLDLLEFDWSLKDNHGSKFVLWSEMLERLIKFKRRYGHCDVPSNYENDKQLVEWVSEQRVSYERWKTGEKSKMNEKRAAALEALGFCWNF